MNRLTLASILLFLPASTAFATTITDLSFILSPNVEFYPPGASPSFCEVNGISPDCLVFSGTLTDNDTDSSIISLEDVYLDFTPDPGAAAYFCEDTNNLTVNSTPACTDNTFYNYVPGALSPDPTTGLPDTYTGFLFGIDFDAATTPYGVYQMNAVIDAAGGDGDPNDMGFTETASFTVIVTPEPAAAQLIFAGLLVLAAVAAFRSRRPGPC